MPLPLRRLPDVVDARKLAAVQAGLPADESVRDAVKVFRALANPVRLSIMHALAHEELSVGDLARALELSLSATSHQLALLRLMKLVESRDKGRLTFYRATDRFVSHLVHDCLAHVGRQLGIPHQSRHIDERLSRRRRQHGRAR